MLLETRYPTKQEVIDRMETMGISKYQNVLEDWKIHHYTYRWRHKTTEEKLLSLEVLIYALYYQQTNPEDIEAIYTKITDRYALHIKTNTVLLDKNKASILSTLHEIGHAIYGNAEKDACAFSIKLFAKIFPKEYSKLKWHGHMLKLPH